MQILSKVFEEPKLPESGDLTDALKNVLGSWDVCSKEWIVRQYDHEVQGGSVTKPLQGPASGPGDAAVWNPLPGHPEAVIVSHGINVRYGDIDPYRMAAAVIDEALRGIIAAGGNLDRVAILDNFCMGSPENPEILGALVRMAQACYDIATVYQVPFISGKDSFYNQYQQQGEIIAVPPTLLVSALGILDNLEYAKTLDLKMIGNPIFVVGLTQRELGGSSYFQTLGSIGNQVPKTDPKLNRQVMNALACANREGLVKSIHDLSDGGLGVALAEMAFSAGIGLEVDLESVPIEGDLSPAEILFSESTGRFAVEVEEGREQEFSSLFEGLPTAQIGEVADGNQVKMFFQGIPVIDSDVAKLYDAWRKPFLGW